MNEFSILDALRIFWPLVVLHYSLAIWAIVDIRKRRNTRYLPKVAWVIIALFVQVLGPVLYFILGRGE